MYLHRGGTALLGSAFRCNSSHTCLVRPTPALSQFLNGFFDYAGLFPPAALPLEAAVEEYNVHMGGSEGFMLSRFVLPVSQVEALSALPEPHPARLSVLAGAPPAETFWLDVRAGLERVAGCFPAGNVRADAVEVRVPDAFLETPARFADTLRESSPILVPVYLEVPPAHPNLAAFADIAKDALSWRLGLKFRTGGLTPDLIPPSATLAAGLVAARDAQLPFKCTAGLHHPIRANHVAFGGMMHGFVNVFGAAMLAFADPAFSIADVTQVLDETDPAAFSFTEGFSWRDLHLTPDVLATLRTHFAHGVGSCSIAEPLADLETLSWL